MFLPLIFEYMVNANRSGGNIRIETAFVRSRFLRRQVRVDIYIPGGVVSSAGESSLLLINDGQDLPGMAFEGILNSLVSNDLMEAVICVGIYCGPDRKMEYGVAAEKDYQGLGAKAGDYTKFILQELLPYLGDFYGWDKWKDRAFAGFSLGALSAFDIVWHHPEVFSRVGAFSGAFWWRNRSYEAGYNEATDRIMHNQVKKGNFHPQLRFFFECGALDETEDRNKNGIIDSIDDTLDLIAELKQKQYTDEMITYLQLEDGRHNIATWARAFPYFLKWGWGKSGGS